MRLLRRIGWWFSGLVGLLVLALGGLFAALQTQPGRNLAARAVAALANRPGFSLKIEGLGGNLPYNMSAKRIAFADRKGVWVTLSGVALDLSPGAFLSGRSYIRLLSAQRIDVFRLPQAEGPSPSLGERLKELHLPVVLAIRRLAVDRLALARGIFGQRVIVKLAGQARFGPKETDALLDIHRIDGEPGKLALALRLAGQALRLRLSLRDPTGLLADRLLGRDDHLPLALSIGGNGPLADWRGRATLSAGALAKVEADLHVAATQRVTATLAGEAAIAKLLPAEYASLVGRRVPISLRAVSNDGRTRLSGAFELAAGRLSGKLRLAAAKETIAGHLAATVPRLAVFSGLIGEPLAGSASLSANVAGTTALPKISGAFIGNGIWIAGSGADRITAHFAASPAAADPKANLAITADGQIGGIEIPDRISFPAPLGRDISWSLAANLPRSGGDLVVTQFSAHGMGVTLGGRGEIGAGARTLAGHIDLGIADLRPFSATLGSPIAGSLNLAIDAARLGTSGFKASLTGSARGIETDEPAANALFGGSVSITAAGRRDAAGMALDRLELTGPAARISGSAAFDAASDRITSRLGFELRHLAPLGRALGIALAGKSSGTLVLAGAPSRFAIHGKITSGGVTVAGMRFTRLHLAANLPDSADPSAIIKGEFDAAGLPGSLEFRLRPLGRAEIGVPRLHLAFDDATIDGKLAVAAEKGLISGRLDGRIRDLAKFSTLAGRPLAGEIFWKATLAAKKGQELDLDLTGNGLGAGGARVGRFAFSGHFGDLWAAPAGSGRLTLADAKFADEAISSGSLSFSARRARQFDFAGEAEGRPLTLAFAGDLGFGADGEALRVTRLSGSLGRDRILLKKPLAFERRADGFSLSGLDLGLGAGRIIGNAAIKGARLSGGINASNLAIAPLADILGYRQSEGTLSLTAQLGGSISAPRAHASLSAGGLGFALPQAAHPPPLGLTLSADWNGRKLALDGRLAVAKGNAIALRGTLPLVMTGTPLALSLPPRGALEFDITGDGKLSEIADLLPIGEDRLAGNYAVDIKARGTVADPRASGKLTLSHGRYENFATGAVLSDINAEMIGDRRRLTLVSLAANDGASGSFKAKGSFDLATARADIDATLRDFRLAATDEVQATASGSIALTGPLAAPNIKAELTANRADLNIPESLPPSVVQLHNVVIIAGNGGKAPAAKRPERPVLPTTLDIKLDLPGRVFVRGRGLDSEWRGELTIRGTAAAPRIAGRLREIHGTFSFLGKTFQLSRGTIGFGNGARIDPTLDILAEATASDVVAQVHVGGTAERPKVTLSSTPSLPQDEILSRVLFDQGLGRISAAQGLELANAAAALAGGGSNVIEKLRGSLGLDWLGFGSGPGGVMSNILRPAPGTTSTTGTTTVSGGKYIAPGVSVGVSQGLSPPTSKVTVQVEVRPHVSVETDLGSSGGSGIGLFYKYDY